MKHLQLTLILLAACAVRAQEFPYTLSAYQADYVPLTGGISLDGGTIWDDPEWTVPLGFSFDLMGESMTEMYVYAPGTQLIPVSAETEVSLLYPYMSDIANASFEEAVSPVRYRVDGEPGSRIFKLEWSNAGFFSEGFELGTFNYTTNFQVWLYEGTNDIDIRFGPNTIKDPGLVHYFGQPAILFGRNVAIDGDSWEALWSIAGDPANPGIQLISGSNVEGLTPEQLLTGEPSDGQVYTFSTGLVQVEEESPALAEFRLYPSTADENLTVFSSGGGMAQVFDTMGRLLESWVLVQGSQQVPVSHLAAGNYIVRSGTYACRFVRP